MTENDIKTISMTKMLIQPDPRSPTDQSLLPGVNVLLEGPTGTGKTHSIGTLVDTGIETYFLALESGMEALIGYWTDRGLPVPPNLHWHKLALIGGGFGDLAKQAKEIGSMTQDLLYKQQDFDRAKKNNFERLLRVMMDFPDQRSGANFGPVDKWGPDRAIVIDGLTGLGLFAMHMVIGNKPVKSQTDWGIAQDNLERLLRLLCDGSAAHFVLLAHVERETDQVQGGVTITVSSLGKALPPKIPPMFSDVILAVRKGTTWTWSTAAPMCDLKSRNLPVAENIEPDFGRIISKWKSRGGKFTPGVQ